MSAHEQLNEVANALLADAPGVALGVSLSGRRTVVTSGTTGSKPGEALARDTLFDLASVSKIAGTTTALMTLVSNGGLTLETRVSAVIPSYSGSTETTLRQLLQHRAGLWEWQPLYLAPGIGDGVNAVMDAMPLRYAPGTERHYSDIGFAYLGRVIEAATGLDLAEACTELVFGPLGMCDTGFASAAVLDAGPTASRSIAASARGDGAERAMVSSGEPYPLLWPDTLARAAQFGWREREIRGRANDGNCFHAFGGVAGHAGLFSTVDDLLTLAEALSGDEAGAAPWRASVARDFFAGGPDAEQALGFRRATIELDGDQHALLWHPGFTGCALGFVPALGLGIALASNRLLSAAPPTPTAELWQPLVAVAARLYTQYPISSRTS